MKQQEQRTRHDIPDDIRAVLVAITHPIGAEILGVLSESQLDVTNLAQRMELDTSTISHHLRRLSDLGLVTRTVAGRHHFYRLTRHVQRKHRGDRQILQITLPSAGFIEIRWPFDDNHAADATVVD